ncbi:MAG: hypothetical protein ACLQVF_00125 [Isosphaeraceae bacterium]
MDVPVMKADQAGPGHEDHGRASRPQVVQQQLPSLDFVETPYRWRAMEELPVAVPLPLTLYRTLVSRSRAL